MLEIVHKERKQLATTWHIPSEEKARDTYVDQDLVDASIDVVGILRGSELLASKESVLLTIQEHLNESATDSSLWLKRVEEISEYWLSFRV